MEDIISINGLVSRISIRLRALFNDLLAYRILVVIPGATTVIGSPLKMIKKCKYIVSINT